MKKARPALFFLLPLWEKVVRTKSAADEGVFSAHKAPSPASLCSAPSPARGEGKKAPVEAGAHLFRPAKAGKRYLSVRCLSAVPRMSPSVAPESEEPYCAMASFSSATSSALIETCTLRAFF